MTGREKIRRLARFILLAMLPVAGCGDSPSSSPECTRDSDCRTFSDTCMGCNCRSLPRTTPDPVCSGTPTACLVDPCRDRIAACDATSRRCVLR